MFPLGPFPNPGKHGLYPARTKYAPVRKSSILRLHWQETDAWQSARRKDEGFLSNCIKSAGEGAFQGAVSLTAVQRTGRVYPRADPLLFCPPIVKRPPLPAGPEACCPPHCHAVRQAHIWQPHIHLLNYGIPLSVKYSTPCLRFPLRQIPAHKKPLFPQ